MAPSPNSYIIRVVDDILDKHYDSGVGADGRVEFDVAVYSRHCTQYLFGAIKVYSPTPVEERKVIWLLRSGKVVCKLSATDIDKLPADSDGFHILRADK